MVIEVDLRLFHLSLGMRISLFLKWMAILRLRQDSFPAHSRRVLRRLLWESLCFISFHFVSCSTVYNKSGEYCIYRSQPETEMSCTAGGRDVLYSRRRRCLVWPDTEMSCMAGDRDVLYGRRRWFLVWRFLVWREMTVDSGTSWWHSAVLVRSYIYWPCGPLR